MAKVKAPPNTRKSNTIKKTLGPAFFSFEPPVARVVVPPGGTPIGPGAPTGVAPGGAPGVEPPIGDSPPGGGSPGPPGAPLGASSAGFGPDPPGKAGLGTAPPSAGP